MAWTESVQSLHLNSRWSRKRADHYAIGPHECVLLCTLTRLTTKSVRSNLDLLPIPLPTNVHLNLHYAGLHHGETGLEFLTGPSLGVSWARLGCMRKQPGAGLLDRNLLGRNLLRLRTLPCLDPSPSHHPSKSNSAYSTCPPMHDAHDSLPSADLSTLPSVPGVALLSSP